MRGTIYLLVFLFAATFVMADSACTTEPTSRTFADFLNEIPSITLCSAKIQSFGVLPSDGNVVIDVTRYDGSHEYVTVTLAGGVVTGLSRGQSTCARKITISEADADAVLGSADRGAAAKYFFKNKGVKVQGCTFLSRIGLFFIQPIGRMAITLPAQQPQPTPDAKDGALRCDYYNAPTKKIVTCAAYKAGDTFCANAMGSAQAVAVTCEENGLVLCEVPCSTYSAVKLTNRCSFDINRARGTQAPPIGSCPAVQAPAAGLKNPGEVCQHGGECRTGNCVGVGQGPPWTYQCSCDPFTFKTNC